MLELVLGKGGCPWVGEKRSVHSHPENRGAVLVV